MKAKLLVSLLLIFCVLGCSDERLSQPMEILFFDGGEAAPPKDVIGPPPPRIQALLWDDFGTREELLSKLIDLKHGDPQVDEEFMANWYLSVIAEMDQKRNYYRKYINAGGVAVVGSIDVLDIYFIEAKRIILTMTAKYPEIRERLQPKNSGFYMIIFSGDRAFELPEFLFKKPSFALGKCVGLNYCFSRVGMDTTTPLPHGYPLRMKVFVHEFAHAMHWAIKREIWTKAKPSQQILPLDPTFDDRLKAAYETAKSTGKWRSEKEKVIIDGKVVKIDHLPTVDPYIIRVNHNEYWAEGVVYWYYLETQPPWNKKFATREEFAAYDPLLYSLLSEWLHEGTFVGRVGR